MARFRLVIGTFPCVCRGDPDGTVKIGTELDFSPYVRGCSPDICLYHSLPDLFPAYAGVIPATTSQRLLCWAFPACAEVIPNRQSRNWSRCASPRICGGAPLILGHYSVGAITPRKRGGDPMEALNQYVVDRFSPHMRG